MKKEKLYFWILRKTRRKIFWLFQNSQIWKIKDKYIHRLITDGNCICNNPQGLAVNLDCNWSSVNIYGWMASLTRWTWVWLNSGSWWWTGRSGVLQFMGSQRVGHDWVTELNWNIWWMSGWMNEWVKSIRVLSLEALCNLFFPPKVIASQILFSYDQVSSIIIITLLSGWLGIFISIICWWHHVSLTEVC